MDVVSIVGMGFVGNALFESFEKRNIKIIAYDKYKKLNNNILYDCTKAPIIFLCLPTPYCSKQNKYDMDAIHSVLNELNILQYTGLIVIKSTVEPTTTQTFSERYKSLSLIHNPEFLSVKTAIQDVDEQNHIIIGTTSNTNNQHVKLITYFFNIYYPKAYISVCTSNESESAKIFCNCFYSVKIQFFNELYTLCQKCDIDFEKVKSLMIQNGWINPMHTDVPGHDGKLSYGGACFPKDTQALLAFMKSHNSDHLVLENTVIEQQIMRND
jgi:nucleotide sugar dehydrogenase